VKRRDFVRELESKGCRLKRHVGRHDIFVNPANGRTSPVPRHSEVEETLVKAIRKQLGLA
jgi:predicted RNA binding protein YcfA (HicA-like mRNA interferase family)